MDLTTFSWILIVFASISQTIGGLLDITRKPRICYTIFNKEYCASKTHLWKDSMFLLVLAIAINIISRTK